MPYTQSQDGTRIYFEVYRTEVQASGEEQENDISDENISASAQKRRFLSYPLLLIEGLGYARWMWFKQIPFFEPFCSTIVFDNRGVGRSEKPDIPYTLRQMADDAIAVLDALNIKQANVLGYSMGSFIAQELALAYPQRTHALILGGTSLGGNTHVPPPAYVTEAMTPDPNTDAASNIRRGMAVAARERYYDEHLDELKAIVRWRLKEPTPTYAYLRQAHASASHDTASRISQLHCPVLIIVASEDIVVPPENGERVASALPNARLVRIEDAGHHVFIEKADQFNREVLAFLQSCEKCNVSTSIPK